MERVIVGRPFTLSKTFYSDGVAVTPTGTPTVAIVRDDGTSVTVSAVSGSGVGPYQATVTAAENDVLDALTVTWTATISGQPTPFVDIVEVAGDVLFTIAQARALSPLSNATAYPTAAIVEARTMVETALEEACGVAFVPRYRRERVSGTGRSVLMLRPRLRAIRAVSVDDSAVTQAYLDTIRVLPTGEAYYPSWWARGFSNLEIAYEHGYDYPPPRVSQAALLWCKNFLVKGPIDDRTTSLVSEDGTFALSTPGMRGAMVGIPEVDAVIDQYSLAVGVA